MKIAIHNRPDCFSDRWIEYCEKHNIDYKVVNAYDSNIIEQVKDCDVFMWHHHQNDYRDALFAKQLLNSLQISGKRVFPDFNTGWHFDDKVGQKYLLEAIGAPIVPSYVFYSKSDALRWIETTSFPKVFKLRGGAGSQNVLLAHNRNEARNLIKKAFGKGFPQSGIKNKIKEDYRLHSVGNMPLFSFAKDIAAYYLKPGTFHKMHSPEKGYVYFQDFIPNNAFDIRICVVGDKAFGLKRLTRKGDFRASGSGCIIYDKEQIDERCVKIAFGVNAQLKMQSVAFDFVFDENNTPLIVEISYGYAVKAYDNCEGFWDNGLVWHEGSHFDFCGWMVENLIN